jgi:putative two-component system response regulator
VREFSPQVLLVDAMMPILDGYQLCAAVRADPVLARQPYTIMLTASNDEGHHGATDQAGIDEFMTKPFDPAAVAARVRELVDRPV